MDGRDLLNLDTAGSEVQLMILHYTSLVWIGAPSETKMVGFVFDIQNLIKITWYTEDGHQLCGDIIVTTACFVPRDSTNFMTNMLKASFRMLYQRRTRLVGDNLSICYGVLFSVES